MYIPTLDFNKHLIPDPLMCGEYSWHVEVKQISKKDDTTPFYNITSKTEHI